jgi:prolipoprotein diacylglyceryl transferase
MNVLLFIHWNLEPNIPLPFDFFSIQWYGFMWTLSIFGSFFLGKWILKKENISEEHLVLLIQYIFIGSIVGARLGQVIFYDLPYFLENPLEIFKVWKGGLASHGGVIGGVLSVYIFSKTYPQYSMRWIFDRVALVIFLPAALIRIGNFFNSELYGRITDVPWAVIFDRVDNLPRHAVVLYEAGAYLLLQLVAILLYRKYSDTKPFLYVGIFFAGTFSVRFLLEFMKEAEGNLFLGYISKTQLLSVPLILVGLTLLLFAFRKKEGSNT